MKKPRATDLYSPKAILMVTLNVKPKARYWKIQMVMYSVRQKTIDSAIPKPMYSAM